MKKLLTVLLSVLMILALAGCGSTETGNDTTEVEEKGAYKVVYLVNGNLGDKSFFDSAEAGLTKLEADGRIIKKTVEMGGTEEDKPKWLQNLYDYSEDGTYDLIICGTYQMPDYLKEVAAKYPDQKYVIFDDTTYAGEQKNVLNISYLQNEMGYCVGVLAAGLNETGTIGFVGGVDSPVINDFLVGYIEGAQSVNPDIKVDTRYIGDYVNVAKGKEIGTSMVNDTKCDVIWGVGGDPGSAAVEPVLDARNNGGKQWFIGVDSDQELTFTAEKAAVTITSGLKNIGNSLIWIIDQLDAGKADAIWGNVVELGLKEDGVGMVTDKNFAKYVPAELQEKVKAALAGVQDGTIKVSSALTDNDGAIAKRNAVQPAQ